MEKEHIKGLNQLNGTEFLPLVWHGRVSARAQGSIHHFEWGDEDIRRIIRRIRGISELELYMHATLAVGTEAVCSAPLTSPSEQPTK